LFPRPTKNLYASTPEGSDTPALGTLGAAVSATGEFDGWGTIPEAIDPAFQCNFGRNHLPDDPAVASGEVGRPNAERDRSPGRRGSHH